MKEKIKKILPVSFLNQYYKYKYKLTYKYYFKKFHGYDLNLQKPKTFNEKVYFRKHFGDQKKMAAIADKYKVRKFVKKKIGEKYLVPLHGVYDSFTINDFNKLPLQFVLKANHASGNDHIEVVADKSSVSADALVKKFQRSLNEDYGVTSGEDFYKRIERKIIAEHYLDEGLFTPNDYKFHCFKNGKSRMIIQVNKDRHAGEKTNLFDRSWNKLDYKVNVDYADVDQVERPKNLEIMIELAETLADEFNYLRVDFYNINGKIYFGELTQTTCSGLLSFTSQYHDYLWGQYWKIDELKHHIQ